MTIDAVPFRAEIPESALDDLRARLTRTRWPAPAPDGHGLPLPVMRGLCAHWMSGYRWRDAEARLNAIPQFLITVGGLRLHVLHARSPHPGAFPLILTHGWPGSVLELIGLVRPLTHPEHPEDAFDVIIPSLPGYGFSEWEPGWGIGRIAAAWAELMAGLGYARYGAAGSDWGTSVSSLLALTDPDHVAGIHLIPPLAGPRQGDELTVAETRALQDLGVRAKHSSAYSEVHRTAPQTVGYALLDSPAGLCAWMAEKLLAWGDGLTPDQILDQVTLYWLTGTAATAASLYAESIDRVAGWIDGTASDPVPVPAGASIFAGEVPRPSRRWAQRRYPDLRYWSEHDRGAHFPALEVPGLLVADLRAFFRLIR
jgi:pimeloyl-ACP methyl ester carboxylesterase